MLQQNPFTHNNKIMSPMATHLLSRVVVVICILFVTCNGVAEAGRKNNLYFQKLEVQNHLKYSNKPPVKSIKSPDGDIIDCIHIAHQPAFGHPLLKNHTIQMRPNYHPESVFAANKIHAKGSKWITQLWHLNGRCPEGTVPIRRTKKDDIFRASSVKTFEKNTHETIPQLTNPLKPPTLRHNEYAIAYVEGEQYYGAQATINIWNPQVLFPDEYSSSQILLRGGSFEDLNIIKAGWQVFPDLYGDGNTRFFIYWTDDIYKKTDCFNLQCPGFIQVSNKIALGASQNLSTYDGAQYEFTLYIEKDSLTGDWWLVYANGTTGFPHEVGYWPAELFPKLADGASMIQWGGEIVNSRRSGLHTSTQMGSGRFSEEGFGNSSYFWNIQIVNISYLLTPPKNLRTFTTQSSCYNIKTDRLNGQDDYFFLYGGPGSNSYCI